MKFLNLFGRLKSNVIGMIHVRALPGNAFDGRTNLIQERLNF